jgi:hypothetical protein
MLTRGHVWHPYFPLPVERQTIPGSIRVSEHKGITQTWAVARPVVSPVGLGAPLYLAGNERPNGPFQRGGMMPLTPAKPNLEMDPSDPSTWQRKYTFTQ